MVAWRSQLAIFQKLELVALLLERNLACCFVKPSSSTKLLALSISCGLHFHFFFHILLFNTCGTYKNYKQLQFSSGSGCSLGMLQFEKLMWHTKLQVVVAYHCGCSNRNCRMNFDGRCTTVISDCNKVKCLDIIRQQNNTLVETVQLRGVQEVRHANSLKTQLRKY